MSQAPAAPRPRSLPRSSEPVPRRWPGGTAVIAGSGASLTRAQLDHCRGKVRVVVINRSWELAPWADVLYACDHKWWTVHGGAPGFEGERWTQVRLKDPKEAREELEVVERYRLRWVESRNEPGLSLDPRVIHQHRNGGFQTMNLAALMGAKRLGLLGFDMHGPHWHEDHAPPLTNFQPHALAELVEEFAAVAPAFAAAGVEVINCSPGSALTCFPMRPLEEVIP